MKIIDLLNKIANGEEVPEKIIFRGIIYKYNEGIDYENMKGQFLLSGECIDIDFLNDEVEILEEKKKIPEKIKDKYTSQISKVELAQKYNEIIDYLESQV